MTPILRQLRSWQAREWLFSACVAVAAVLLFAAAGVTLACLIDYWCDGAGETPFWVRVFLLVVQVALYVGAAWLAFRFVRTPSAVSLAGRAEAAHTEFDHRLVTALQLNRPTARTAGMSKNLIDAVTNEAHDIAGKKTLANLTDPKRLLWALLLLLPVLVWAGVAFGFFAPLTTALLKRQLLLDVDIPRSVEVENATAPLFPAGDPLQLQVKVVGPVSPDTTGTVRVKTADGRTDEYPLRYTGPAADSKPERPTHKFVADLPAATESFTFTAQVKDGRMRKPAEVRFEARPVVMSVAAWVLAPKYVDPDGQKRFEKLTNQGEVICHPDCVVRVLALVSKPLKSATLVLVGKGPAQQVPGPDGKPVTQPGKDEERRVPLELGVVEVPDPNGQAVREVVTASATFGLPPGVNGYRIEVTDANGFANLVPPRRGVTVLPDRPPTVTLNDELLMPGWETGPADDYEVRGMPLVENGQIQIGYAAKTALGVGRAAIIYRVNDGPWTLFPLAPTKATEEKEGKFRPELGVFTRFDVGQNVELYPLPSPDPDGEPDGLAAGGRYNFATAALTKTDKDGKRSKLVVGDRVEFRVAVYDRKHTAMDTVLPKALPLLDEMSRAATAKDADTLTKKLAEFAAVPLLPEAEADAARTAVGAYNPNAADDTAAALADLRKRLQAQRAMPLTDTDTASRPPDERAGLGRPAGYSESRLKAVVTDGAFQQWRDQQARSRERLREIEKLQQGVFGGGKK